VTTLPPLFTCHYCHNEIEPNSPDTYRRSTGWVQNRRPTLIALASPDGGFACAPCVTLAKLGGTPDQQTSLF